MLKNTQLSVQGYLREKLQRARVNLLPAHIQSKTSALTRIHSEQRRLLHSLTDGHIVLKLHTKFQDCFS